MRRLICVSKRTSDETEETSGFDISCENQGNRIKVVSPSENGELGER